MDNANVERVTWEVDLKETVNQVSVYKTLPAKEQKTKPVGDCNSKPQRSSRPTVTNRGRSKRRIPRAT